MPAITVTLTEIATGLTLVLPVTPETLPADYGMTERRWEPIEANVVSAPKAADVPVFTLTAWLPGAGDVGSVFVDAAGFRQPIDLEYQLRTWMWNRAVLQYVATQTSFNSSSCTIRHLKPVWGELDRMGYELELHEGGTLVVTAEQAAPPDATPAPDTTAPPGPESPTSPPVPSTHTVVAGDTLTGLAKSVYGSASQWTVLWDANRQSPSNPKGLTTPDVLPLGFPLSVPAGTASPAQAKAA